MREQGASLRTAEGLQVPLDRVEMRGELLGGFGQLVLRQHYCNREDRAIEAIYTFPLPSDATLVGFSMECDGRTLLGEVKEREAAFAQYDDAMMKGDGAALLDQERHNVFTASVGNLLPNEQTVIEVVYVQRVPVDEGSLRWMIPTLVAPRYIPGELLGDRSGDGWASPTNRVPDADRITPRTGDATYALSLDLVVDLGVPVHVESPSHKLSVTSESRTRSRVRFSQKAVSLDRDIVLVACAKEDVAQFVGSCAHQLSDHSGVFALTVVPDIFDGKTAEQKTVVFLVDVSGSMQGPSIEQAKAALRLCLRQLSDGDRFNIIAFSSRSDAFASSPVPFSQQTLTTADSWVSRLDAHGGTELLKPLVSAMQMAERGVVVLMTDGQVGNEGELLKAAIGASKGARIYSFGIGTNVSDALLRDLAKHSQGAVQFIYPGERIDDKVVKQFAHAVARRVTDITIQFEGVELDDICPMELSHLVDGEAWVLMGHYENPSEGSLTLRGRIGEENFTLKVPVMIPANASCPALPKVWASERIQDLERLELTGRREKAMKDRILRIALEYQVMCKDASFVVVERRQGARKSHGIPETRYVAVHTPFAWDMARPSASKGAAALMMSSLGALGGAFGAAASVVPAGFKGLLDSLSSAAPAAPPPPAARCAAPAPMSLARKRQGVMADSQPADVLREPLQEAEHREMSSRALLAQQLASGLWGGGKSEVEATIRSLAVLVRGGITSADPSFGTQIKKAVSALLRASTALSDKAHLNALFAICWLASTGQRSRRELLLMVNSRSDVQEMLSATVDDDLLWSLVDRAIET